MKAEEDAGDWLKRNENEVYIELGQGLSVLQGLARPELDDQLVCRATAN